MYTIHRHTQLIIFNYIITTHIPKWVHICTFMDIKLKSNESKILS